PNRYILSFPTRRSSDLQCGGVKGFPEPIGFIHAADGEESRGHVADRSGSDVGVAPDFRAVQVNHGRVVAGHPGVEGSDVGGTGEDRKSTRLNSSHRTIS